MRREKETFDTKMKAEKKILSEKRKNFVLKMKKRAKDLEMSQDAIKIPQQRHPSKVHDEPSSQEVEVEEEGSCKDGNGGKLHRIDVDNLEVGCLAWLHNHFYQTSSDLF